MAEEEARKRLAKAADEEDWRGLAKAGEEAQRRQKERPEVAGAPRAPGEGAVAPSMTALVGVRKPTEEEAGGLRQPAMLSFSSTAGGWHCRISRSPGA